MPRRRLLSSGELAADLGLARRTITRYAREGWITPTITTPGGRYRWDADRVVEELAQLAEKRRQQQRRAGQRRATGTATDEDPE